MAQTTRNLTATKSGYVKSANPDTVYRTNSTTNYLFSNDLSSSNQNRLYFGFNAFPSSLKHNLIYGLSFIVQLRPGRDDVYAYYCGDFTETTLTWRNKPNGSNTYATFTGAGTSAPGAWGNKTGTVSDAFFARNILVNKTLYLTEAALHTNDNDNWYAKTVLANGNAPYFKVTYDDTEKIISTGEWVNTTSKKGWITENPANSGKSYELSWNLTRDLTHNPDGACLQDTDDSWTQASATLKWRVQGTSSWNTGTSVSGSTKKMTVPAGTFPTGKTVEYYVSVTDTEGTTSSTATKTATFAASQIVAQNVPTAGYVNPRNAIDFSWYFDSNGYAIPSGNVKLYWKQTTASSYTQVSAAAGANSLTIAANTFPTAAYIQWYLSGTDSTGASSSTEVYTFSTTAGTATATPVSPINSVENGEQPIVLSWTLSSTDGQTPSAVSLAWALDTGGTLEWNYLLTQASARTSYTAQPNTFSPGKIIWSVQAYNVDGTAGGWKSVRFVCVSPPRPITGLSATPEPRTVISWQSDDQQAYEVTIDGEVYRKEFGTASSFRVQVPLADGVHTITVRVQGQYGLWSEPQTVTINVQNVTPEGWENVVLTGEFGIDAELLVDIGREHAGTVCWYRDGKLIGQTKASEATEFYPFTDSRVVGTHEYYVELWFLGFYARSNTVTGTMYADEKMICAFDGSSEWISLRLSENSMDTDEHRFTQEQITQHVKGAVWPHAEKSTFRDMSSTYNCAFVTKEEAKAFEALFGKVVIIKGRGDEISIGVLSQLQKRINLFYTSYNFTIQQSNEADYKVVNI